MKSGFSDILSPDRVIPALSVSCEKQAFLRVADYAARMMGLDERKVFNVLMERERLGNTTIGGGVAIPHARIEGLDEVIALFVRLVRPVDFGAQDGRPVDLLFVLLAPEEESGAHLKALARVTRFLHDADIRDRLREAADSRSLFQILA